MHTLSPRPADWGKHFKSKHLNNQIKKLDYHFKVSLFTGAFFIALSFLIAIALGYVLFAGVSLVVGSVLGIGCLLWQRSDKSSSQKPFIKPISLPVELPVPPLATPLAVPKQHSVAKMHEIWEEIVQVPSVKKPNQIQ